MAKVSIDAVVRLSESILQARILKPMTQQIINISDLNPSWNWLADQWHDSALAWYHYSSLSVNIPSVVPKHESIARAYTALRGVIKTKKSDAILVSHGPRPTMYVSGLANKLCPATPHLAFSFTFTHLPTGKQRDLMAKAYRHPQKFVCFSTFEKTLYANYFGIPIEKIDMVHWSANAPVMDANEQPTESGRYICALGTQGRDYASLFAAMKKLPHITLIAVVSPEYITGLEIPENVIIRSNIPLSQAFNILKFSEFMVLPLRDSTAPCGHSTIVASMFFKKTMLITNAETVYDYIENGKTGLFFEANNAQDLQLKIASLWEDQTNTSAMNEAAYQFAKTYCSEKSALNYFSAFLNTTKT